VNNIRDAREFNVDAEKFITRHRRPGPGYNSDQVTKNDIVMALLRTIQAMDALLQAVADPEQQRAERADMVAVREEAFVAGLQAGAAGWTYEGVKDESV
jgi:hypothetical protein